MAGLLIKVFAFIISGLIWRLVASVGFTIFTIGFVNTIVNDYINRALQGFQTSMPPMIVGLLGLAKIDLCISIWINALIFVSTYKSLKFIFVRK